MRSLTTCRFGAAALVLLAIAAFGASAYDQPLSPESVRSAYFLGRHTEQARSFLSRYEKGFPSPPSSEINIARIQLLTPYAQIVSASFTDLLNNNAVDADQTYAGRSLPVLLRIWVYCPGAGMYNSGPFKQFERLVRSFTIAVSQSRPLASQGATYTTLYYSTDSGRWPNGLEVELTFDAAQFRPKPVHIAISAPNGQHAEAVFDLSQLK
jgi:hypothetical protein